jgi:hypothetical protein
VSSDGKRELLRHALATLAYRGGKAIRECPDDFAALSAIPGGRTPVQILAHMGDLMDWALSIARGKQVWQSSAPLPWDQETERFFAAIKRLDDFLASDTPLAVQPEKLFQGPLADALTHVGQLTILRRLARAPIRAESYFVADIQAGRVGAEQAPPRKEFD